MENPSRTPKIVAAILFLVVIVLALIVLKKESQTSDMSKHGSIPPSQLHSSSSTGDSLKQPQGAEVFISQIPADRRANLQLEDLPSTAPAGYAQSKVTYNGHEFIAATPHILEFDSSHTLVRYSDQKILNCPEGLPGVLALEEDRLYVACWNDGIYEVNLTQNRVTYKYDQAKGLKNNQNLLPIILDGTMWVSSFNGLAKIDLKTHRVRMYQQELGLPSPGDDSQTQHVTVAGIADNIWAISRSGVGAAQYQKLTDSWKVFPPSAFNRRDPSRVDFDLFLPTTTTVFAIHQDSGPDHVILSQLDLKTDTWSQKKDVPYAQADKAYASYLSQGMDLSSLKTADRRYTAALPVGDNHSFLMSTQGIEELKPGDAFPVLKAKADLNNLENYRMIRSTSRRYILGMADLINVMGGRLVNTHIVVYDTQKDKTITKTIQGKDVQEPPAVGLLKDPSAYTLIEHGEGGSVSLNENGKEVLSVRLY